MVVAVRDFCQILVAPSQTAAVVVDQDGLVVEEGAEDQDDAVVAPCQAAVEEEHVQERGVGLGPSSAAVGVDRQAHRGPTTSHCNADRPLVGR